MAAYLRLCQVGRKLSSSVLSVAKSPTTQKYARWAKSSWAVIAYALLLNIILTIVFYTLPHRKITFINQNLLVIIIEVAVLATLVSKEVFRSSVNNSHPLHLFFAILQNFLWLVLLGMVIAKVVATVLGGMADPLNLGDSLVSKVNFNFGQRIALLIFQVFSVLCDLFVITSCWALKGKFSTLFFCLTQGLGFVLGVVKLYTCVYNFQDIHRFFATIFYFVMVDSLGIAGTFLGMSFIVVLSDLNRLSKIILKLSTLIYCYYTLLLVLEVTKLAVALHHLVKYPSYFFKELSIMYIITVFVDIATLVSTGIVCSFPSPELMVEELNLDELTTLQKDAFANLISSNSKANPGVSGKDILSLMEAYCNSYLKDVDFTVLRVYKPVENKPQEFEMTYENNKSWKHLDEELNIFIKEDESVNSEDVLSLVKPMSKNQRKRMAKKAMDKKNGKNSVSFPLNEIKTKYDFEDEKRFYSKLMTTEALVLITQVRNYEITSSLNNLFGDFLARNFGKNSKNKLLCINLGLLGFHWPFRRSTFYCSSTKHPVARSAAVSRAISGWNMKQPKSTRNTVLIDPTYAGDWSSRAIPFAGWTSAHIPPTNIIDLRPHKKRSATDYFKAVKYRVQSESFHSAGGEVIEDDSFSKELCDMAMALWKNIATAHEENGYTAYLANPDSSFVQSLGREANQHHSRSLLFLKVDGEVIASCILFRLGDTITSDIQGLHHDIARKYKAYFVMMEEVIKIALREKKDFVDFGPTTDKPKQDIGCQSVPIVGGMTSSSCFISPAIKFAASKVKV